MEQIITKETMTSLEIAEITGKQHAHVMRDIRNLLEQGVSESNFGLSSYKQAQPNGGTVAQRNFPFSSYRDAHNFVETYYVGKSNRQQRCFSATKNGVKEIISNL